MDLLTFNFPVAVGAVSMNVRSGMTWLAQVGGGPQMVAAVPEGASEVVRSVVVVADGPAPAPAAGWKYLISYCGGEYECLHAYIATS